ncbi:MAG: type II secretion system protein GspG [Planctomycetota bacterium]
MKLGRCFGSIGILVALAPAFGTVSVGGERPIDELLPADALVVLGVNDVNRMVADMATMPLGKILAEEGVRTFLDGPWRQAQGLIEVAMQKLRQEEPSFPELELDKIVCAGYHRLFVALTHVKLPDFESTDPSGLKPEVGFVLGLEPGEGTTDLLAIAQKMIREKIGSLKDQGVEGWSMVAGEHGGASFLMVETPEGPPVCFAKVGGLSLLSLDLESLKTIIDLAAGKGASLASNPEYQSARKQLGGSDPAAVLVYLNVPRLMQFLCQGVKLGLGAQGETDWVGKVDEVFAASGLAGLGPVAASSISSNGVGVKRVFSATRGPATGLLALAQGGAVDRERLAWVPKDATSCSLGQIDLKGFYDGAMQLVKVAVPTIYEQVEQMRAMVTAQLTGGADNFDLGGFDLVRDFLGNIGTQYVFYSVPTQGFMATGEYVFIMETRDAGKVEQGLRLLFQIPGAKLDTPLNLKEVEQEGCKLFTVDLTQLNPAFAMVAAQLQPSFAFHDGYLVAGSTPRGVKAALERIKVGGESILANEDFQRFYGKIPADVPLYSLSYSNIRQSFDSIYNQVVGLTFMPPFSQVLEKLPLDLALLPTSDEISKHLFGSLTYSYRVEGGFISESYGPFGVELVPIVAGAAGLVGFGAYSMAQSGGFPMGGGADVAVEPQPVEESAEERVATDFGYLKAGILVFKYDQGRLPDNLEDLLQSTETFPDGYLPGSDLPVDPWGHAYRYVRINGSGYQLSSMGPNGKDENGEGDDIAEVVNR